MSNKSRSTPDPARRAARSGPRAVALTRSRTPWVRLALALRPKQWLKNILVLAAPSAAGVVTRGDAAWKVGVTFLSFCAVSSSGYLVNDLVDVEEDRRHPVKRWRPIASGEVGSRLAIPVAAALAILGFALAGVVRWPLLALVAGYLATSLAYTFWLKHVAVLDISVVASGFLLRTLAGGIAVEVPVSRWFLIVASFGSLFVVAGKRYREHITMGAERATVRTTLATYSQAYLRYLYMMSAAVMLAAYALWAFNQSHAEGSVPWLELSIIPVVAAVLRYALLLEAGAGEAPEDIFLRDRQLQMLGLTWTVLFGAGVSVVR